MFRTIWTIAAVILGIAWVIFGVWWVVDYFQAKKRPKPTTKRQQQAKTSFEEYVRKMKEYKKPIYKRDETEDRANTK
ncbi:MAG: hypothetical protein ACYSTG_00890 [Planctomycetota bacterium]|jgi:hypothetical protein